MIKNPGQQNEQPSGHPSGRPSGRRNDELRSVDITLDYIDYPEGSALITMGRTRVLCNASLQAEVPGWLAGRGRGWITAEYGMLPRATHTRSPRETDGLRGRTQEIRRLIGRSLRAAVDLERLGERAIIVDCDVLQADGGTRTASITGGYVALALALRRLADTGEVPADILSDEVAAVSAGIVDGTCRLDLCYAEDSQAEVDINIVMTGDGRLIEVQGTAERAPFTREQLDAILDLAQGGIGTLIEEQRRALARS